MSRVCTTLSSIVFVINKTFVKKKRKEREKLIIFYSFLPEAFFLRISDRFYTARRYHKREDIRLTFLVLNVFRVLYRFDIRLENRPIKRLDSRIYQRKPKIIHVERDCIDTSFNRLLKYYSIPVRMFR